MPAITIFDSQEEIPESLRESATEVEGKFHVDASKLIAKHNEILGEKKNRDAEIKRLRQEAEKYKDLDPEKARAALEAAQKAEEDKLRVQGDWDAREKALRDGFTAKETEFQAEISSRDKALDKFVIFNELARVSNLPEIKGDAELLEPHIAPFIRRKGLTDYEILDPSGNVRYSTKDGEPLRMDEYLRELREHAKLSRLFDATGATGSGAATDLARGGGAKIDKSLRRSKMSDKEQADFVREHGYAKFKDLPA